MLKRVDKQTWDEANRLIGLMNNHRNQVAAHPEDVNFSAYLTYLCHQDKSETLVCLIVPGNHYPNSSLLLADLPAIEAEYEKRYSGN